jgi:hypothetical protein
MKLALLVLHKYSYSSSNAMPMKTELVFIMSR